MICSPASFAANTSQYKALVPGGELCFWGHKLSGANNDHEMLSVLFDAADNILTILFRDNKTLTISNPGDIFFSAGNMIIQTADRVYFEWRDTAKLTGIFFYEFRKDAGRIIGNNNIHWSVINVNALSAKKPAVTITGTGNTQV